MIDSTLRKVIVFLKNHWVLLLVLSVFLIYALVFVKFIPPMGSGGGPDENAHYKFNVAFILDNHRLPVSGQDDLEAYANCRINNYGLVPCLYSYVAYPGANYVFSALFAWIVHEFFNLSPLIGARLASVFWGVVYVTFIYLMARRLTRNNMIAGVLTGAAALIPQLIFTISYVNQDAHSLAIAAIVTYSLTVMLQNPTRRTIIIAGITFGGLLPLAKYNYFIYGPFLVVAIMGSLYIGKLKLRQVATLTVCSIVSFVLIASFWYIRNAFLYGDPLGQSFVINKMAEFHALGTPHDLLSLATYKAYALDNTYFDRLFNSFFVAFGYMQHYLKDFSYAIIQALSLALIFICTCLAFRLKKIQRTKALLTITGAVLFVFSTTLLAYYNATHYDFQPQGRYLYPIIPVLVLALGYLYTINIRFIYPVLLAGFIVLYANYVSIDVIIRSYIV